MSYTRIFGNFKQSDGGYNNGTVVITPINILDEELAAENTKQIKLVNGKFSTRVLSSLSDEWSDETPYAVRLNLDDRREAVFNLTAVGKEIDLVTYDIHGSTLKTVATVDDLPANPVANDTYFVLSTGQMFTWTI